jgi:DNA-binding XRE family transcriptional regulator
VTPRWGATTPRARIHRGRPRSFFEWATLRRWGKLPPWEVDQAGYLLRLAREEAGLTQSELAARLGVSQQAVSRAEAWTSNPTVGLLRRWLGACGWTMRIEAEPDG